MDCRLSSHPCRRVSPLTDTNHQLKNVRPCTILYLEFINCNFNFILVLHVLQFGSRAGVVCNTVDAIVYI